MKTMNRRPERNGFTLIEVMMVAAIISLLAALAQPGLQRVLVKARATEAVSNLNAVKVAIQNYEAEFFRYPAESGSGTIPTGLEPYLPSGFTFSLEGYTIDYDNMMGPDGTPVDDGTFSIGLTVLTTNDEIGNAMVDLIGTKVWARGDSRFTWIVF